MSNNRLKSIKYLIWSSACSTNCRFLGGFGLGFARPEPKIFNMRALSTVRMVLFGTLPTDPMFCMVCPICLTLPSNYLPNCVSCPCLDPIVSFFMHPDACPDFFDATEKPRANTLKNWSKIQWIDSKRSKHCSTLNPIWTTTAIRGGNE